MLPDKRPPTLGKGGNVASAGWQVTLCDPMWHVSFRSGVATSRTVIHLLLTYLFTYLPAPDNSEASTIRTHCKAVHCQQSYLLLQVFHHPLTLSFQAEKLPFLQILPTAAFHFSSGLTTCIPHTVYCYFSAYPFLLFSFSVLVCFTLFSCRFRAADYADSCQLSSAR